MGAYKQLLASDIIVSPLEVNKGFTFHGAAELTGSNVGIDRFLGINFAPFSTNYDLKSGQINPRYCRLVYNSIKELYYSNYANESIYGSPVGRPLLVPGSTPEGDRLIPSGSFPAYDNYLQSTLTFERFYPTASNAVIGVISIPSKLFGDYIKPGSFRFESISGSYYDDGEGNILSGSDYIGNIIYTHGIVTLTGNYYIYNPLASGGPPVPIILSYYGSAVYGTTYVYGNGVLSNFLNSLNAAISGSNVTCSFSSSYTLYETQYKCTIRENEFSYTLNPSTISGSYNTSSAAGQVYGYVTESYFSPYITTVGLYDGDQNLLAVGKLSQPVPSSPTTDTTILINLDR